MSAQPRKLGSSFIAAVVRALCALALWAGSAAAETVVVQTVDGETLSGQVATFTIEGGLLLRLPDARNRTVATPDLVGLRCGADGATEPAASDTQARVEMIDGTRLCGELIGGDNETLSVRHPWLGDIRVPLSRVTGLVAAAATRETPDTLLEPPAKARDRLDDEFLLDNGDRLLGTLRGVQGTTLLVETDAGETAIPLAVLRVAILAATPPRTKAPGLRVALHLSDGSRLIAERVRWEDRSVHVAVGGQEATIPASVVREAEIIGGRWVWLAEVAPQHAEQTPLWSSPWEWRRDRNVRGGPLRIGGRTFRHGMGVHSQSRLVFDLEGKYRTLIVEPGVDDDSGPYADVTARIVVDGRVRFEQTHLTRGQSAGPLRIDLAGAHQLELAVLFGDNADVQDRFDWAGAALIREE